MAVPFVQGRLRGEKVRAEIETECAHCAQPIRLEIDSELCYETQSRGAAPLVCTPFVDVSKLRPSIIDGF